MEIFPDNPVSRSSLLNLASHLSSSNESFRSRVPVADGRLLIQKVPQSVRDSLDECYFVPDVVSIGPYHHRAKPHLVEMEEIKESVAYEFCHAAFRNMDVMAAVSRFHDAVRPILPDARRCYADRFDTITDNDFNRMMVVDGCFLLVVISILTRRYYLPVELEHSSWTRGRMLRIMKDILLFENQIPWAVVHRLGTLCPVDVDQFIYTVLAYFDLDVDSDEWWRRLAADRPVTRWPNLSPAPAHLLDLVHQRHLGLTGGGPAALSEEGRYCDYARPFAHFTSAVELAESGIRVHASGTCRVKDGVRVADKPRLLQIGRLVLPKLALSWLPRCWLINMVALECVTDRYDRSGVSSYLAILGSIVRAERDVEELRSRRILISTMSDRKTVEFFESLLDPLPRQELYLRTLEDIVRLRRRRSIRSGIHAFYYRNRKVIFAVVPLLIAIVGIVVTNSIKHK